MAQIFLSVADNIAFKKSLKKLAEGTETMENHLKLKEAKEKEDREWEQAAKIWG
jgi:hypothetical protein